MMMSAVREVLINLKIFSYLKKNIYSCPRYFLIELDNINQT